MSLSFASLPSSSPPLVHSHLDELAHNLELPVLEALVLEDLFDGHDVPGLHHGCLEDDAKRPIADDSFGGVAKGGGGARSETVSGGGGVS